MACAPSLTHCCSYRCTDLGNNFRRASHSSSSIFSSDCFGTPSRPRGKLAGFGTISYNVSFGYQTMGTMQRGITAPYNIYQVKHEPDHLLVLVHGIFASPKDWTYAEAELKRQLGSNFLIHDMVGWRTSSIRRETELVKPPLQSLDGYKHIVNVKYCPPILSDGPHFPLEAAKAKDAAKNVPNTQNTAEYHDVMEEEMIRGLQRIGWKKVDVSFHSTCWPFFAHNNIHVKSEWLHNAGAGVIAHVAESLKQQESRSLIGASL